MSDPGDFVELRRQLTEAARLIHASAWAIELVYRWLDVEIAGLGLPGLSVAMARRRRLALGDLYERADTLQAAADQPATVKALGRSIERGKRAGYG